MKKRLILLVAFCCVSAIIAVAEENVDLKTEKSAGLRPLSWVQALMNHLDSAAVRKVDARYIEVPKNPWRVILRPKLSDMDVVSDNVNTIDASESLRMKMDLDIRPGTAIGFWVGYRGLGISYSYKLRKNGGTNLTLSNSSAKYGLNMRFHTLKADKLHFLLEDTYDGVTQTVMDDDVRFITPVEILSFYFNGYYVFNGRRYSQAAAYNQSVIQRRSAGSLLLGATIFASSLDMAEKENALLLEMGSCPGSMSLGEINVGLGYGYNWVPARGWVVNAMVMPTISIYDRIKRTNFTSNYTIYPKTGVSGDYGSWDSDKRQWANGETQRPITDGETTVENWLDDAEMWETNTESHTSAFKLNVDARVGVAYCWGRYFVSTNGQLLHFRYNSKGNSMTHGEWYVNTSFGIRL